MPDCLQWNSSKYDKHCKQKNYMTNFEMNNPSIVQWFQDMVGKNTLKKSTDLLPVAHSLLQFHKT